MAYRVYRAGRQDRKNRLWQDEGVKQTTGLGPAGLRPRVARARGVVLTPGAATLARETGPCTVAGGAACRKSTVRLVQEHHVTPIHGKSLVKK